MTDAIYGFLSENRYQDYIFDFYGTLADIHTDEEQTFVWEELAKFYQRENVSCSAKGLRQAYRRHCDDMWREAVKKWGKYAEYDIREVFRRLFLDEGLHSTAEKAEEAALCFRQSSREYLFVYEGIEELLADFHNNGGRVFLLTNAQSAFTLPEIKQLGLDALLDGIFISSDAHMAKPDSRFLMGLAETFHIDLSGALMVGNDRRTDVAVANACGIDSLYVHSNLSPAGGLRARHPWEKSTYVCKGIS